MLTILASYAQEESRSASDNQNWRIMKNFEKGMPWCGRMLGYRIKDGKYYIIPEEAVIVQHIFKEYLEGAGLNLICKRLNDDVVPTRNGGIWQPRTIATLTTETIQQMFLKALNRMIGSREQIIQACEVMHEVVADCSTLNSEIETLNEELQVVAELVSQCVKKNASRKKSQEEYTEKYNRLVKRYENVAERLNKATTERDSRLQRDRELRIFIGSIENQPLVIETWDEWLWLTLLETATVHKDNRITFRFKDGTDIEVGVE